MSIGRFQKMLREAFEDGSGLAKAYLRNLVEAIVVEGLEVRVLAKLSGANDLMVAANGKTPPPVFSKGGEVLVSVVEPLPKRVSNKNFETSFVVDLDAARKRLRPETLRFGREPRIIELLDLAKCFHEALQSGAVNNRADLARRHSLSRARVTQVLHLLKLDCGVEEEIRRRVGGGFHVPSERWLRPLLRRPAAEQQLVFQEWLGHQIARDDRNTPTGWERAAANS